MESTVTGVEEMNVLAARVLSQLKPSRTGATVVTLSGDLGAGKTTFVQGVARVLGITEPITSPTYVIEKVYDLTNQKFERLVHIDAYRLLGAHELTVLGWNELLQSPATLIFVEWPEKVVGAVPLDAVEITLSGEGDTRTVTYDKKDN